MVSALQFVKAFPKLVTFDVFQGGVVVISVPLQTSPMLVTLDVTMDDGTDASEVHLENIATMLVSDKPKL